MTLDQRIAEDVKLRLRALDKVRKDIGDDPEKARQWLIRVGAIHKSGKRAAKR
jgi:hypothetical protein